MPWKSEGMQRYNQLHEEVHQDWLLSEGQRFQIQFKKNETRSRRGTEQKEKNNPIS
jgi:hypothetical protein